MKVSWQQNTAAVLFLVACLDRVSGFGLSALPSVRSHARVVQQSTNVADIMVETAIPVLPELAPEMEQGLVPTVENRPAIPPPSTWIRRLNTKQDRFAAHKISSIGWLISSVVLLGTGLATGFHEAPAFLEPFHYLFLLSTLGLASSAIPIALRYREGDPNSQFGFISTALTSLNMAFLAYWLSPFPCDPILTTWPDIVTGSAVVLASLDMYFNTAMFKKATTSLSKSFSDNSREGKMLRKDRAKNFFMSLGLPVQGPMNIFYIQQVLTHVDHTREYLQHLIVSQGTWGEFMYFDSVLTSAFLGTLSLIGTLEQKKLLPPAVINSLNMGSIGIVAYFNFHASGWM